MNPVTAPLKLSAAGMRMAGYMIESNLRVAQIFGLAALENHPFFDEVLADGQKDWVAKVCSPQKTLRPLNQNQVALSQSSAKPATRKVPAPEPVTEKTASSDQVKTPEAPKAKVKTDTARSTSVPSQGAVSTVTPPKVEKQKAKEIKQKTLVAPRTQTTISKSAAEAALPSQIEASTAVKRPRQPSPPPAMPEPKRTAPKTRSPRSKVKK